VLDKIGAEKIKLQFKHVPFSSKTAVLTPKLEPNPMHKPVSLFRLNAVQRERAVHRLYVLALLLLLPMAAHATPFDSGISEVQTLFTGTIAKAASLIAIVIGGYAFAHGEPGAKKGLAGVAAGTGIAVMAVNVLSWLWGS
jgi:type IV secretion system protein VirB2